MSKKYEIITVGRDKRVRALRSWQVGDRYVNIGDVGGIVYDEKTLSQDGLCWLFSGNFGFPGARIWGDSIVDVGEVSLSSTGSPAVDILGSSVVVGNRLQFGSDQTAANAVVLTGADFEQGNVAYIAGANLETQKIGSAQSLRTKSPIFLGGVTKSLKLEVPGYKVRGITFDRDLNMIGQTSYTATGAGVTLVVPAAQYCVLTLEKNPLGAIVPADATAAQITFTGTYETKLSIIDSRVEINPVTSTGTLVISPGGTYAFISGAKYPEAIIRNSKVSINVPAATSGTFRMMGQIIGSTATLDATGAGGATVAGLYSNVKNLLASGAISDTGVTSYDIIQATDCDNFAVSPMIFSGVSAAQTASMPFIFQGCNVPDGRFYHHAQIANTYKNIDFAKASVDLGKAIASGEILASSEVEGMYRLYSTTGSVFGGLVEGYDSVKSLNMTSTANSYGTTIYKDAYFNGLFEFAGTNVFGHKVPSHPLAQVLNVAPRAVQGVFSTVTVGAPITGVVAKANRVCVPIPFRINGAKGLTINCPTGIEGAIVCTDINGVVKAAPGPVTGESSVPAAQLVNTNAYLYFGKPGNGAITPEDLAGVTVTVYNGCKIMNTGATAVNMKGAIRVEDNATLIDTSVTGTGYFGGNSVIEAPTALTAPMPIEGAAYMKDNAVFSPILVTAGAGISLLDMKNNAVFAGTLTVANTFYNITMADNARFLGLTSTRSGFVMRGNSFVGTSVAIAGACRGLLVMTGKARIESGNLTAVGYITLTGNYRQTATKTWTGKRVIDSQDAPTYDDNVKTQYDF